MATETSAEAGSASNLLIERRDDGTALVTLNRPDRLNALSWPMVREFLAAVAALGEDPDVRVVVLTGAGRGFCAGLDLRDTDVGTDEDLTAVYRRQELVGRLATTLRSIPQPVIAAINGPAAGGGLVMALAADVRIGAPSATFNVAFVRIGLSGCDGGISYLLPRLVGHGIAAELMLTGRRVEAEEAVRVGLLNRVVPAEELLDSTVDLAAQIIANSPFGVWMTKHVLDRGEAMPSLEAAIELENRTQVLATRTEDMREALAAYADRRPAEFKGR